VWLDAAPAPAPATDTVCRPSNQRRARSLLAGWVGLCVGADATRTIKNRIKWPAIRHWCFHGETQSQLHRHIQRELCVKYMPPQDSARSLTYVSATFPAMRDKTISAITWTVIIGLGIAAGLGVGWAKAIGAVLLLVWLFAVALPWLWSERPPPWRRRL